jgi:formamidase
MPPSKYQEAVTKAARTIPPRENGGNMDIKNLSNGSRIFFPVYVKGGLLSLGDCHYAEGDGEVTWNAIEMDGAVRIRVNLIKDGVRKYGIISPVFIPGRHEPRFTEYLTFTGFSFRDDEQHYMDTTFAVRDAVLKAVDYLMRFGYTAPQAYTILSVAPIELRVSEIVDIPNACVTLYIPMEIFDSFFRSK